MVQRKRLSALEEKIRGNDPCPIPLSQSFKKLERERGSRGQREEGMGGQRKIGKLVSSAST
jgi:hypothetical protein